jgi:hypothetical protein
MQKLPTGSGDSHRALVVPCGQQIPQLDREADPVNMGAERRQNQHGGEETRERERQDPV